MNTAAVSDERLALDKIIADKRARGTAREIHMANEAETQLADLRARLVQAERERDAWKEFAEHQILCAVCAENCYDCDMALGLMLAISKVETVPSKWVDDQQVKEYAALTERKP
jgi:hypothetical protein